jgi:hypothetical protein
MKITRRHLFSLIAGAASAKLLDAGNPAPPAIDLHQSARGTRHRMAEIGDRGYVYVWRNSPVDSLERIGVFIEGCRYPAKSVTFHAIDMEVTEIHDLWRKFRTVGMDVVANFHDGGSVMLSSKRCYYYDQERNPNSNCVVTINHLRDLHMKYHADDEFLRVAQIVEIRKYTRSYGGPSQFKHFEGPEAPRFHSRPT